jgi:chorismate dehydratase
LKVKETTPLAKPRLAAVSYLNTLPLVWGFQAGPQRDAVKLEFFLPAECADRTADGRADLGLAPVIESSRRGLPLVGDVGIACRGPVRSILLVTKTAPERIRTLAVDYGSRTSVMLARILLKERFGVDDADLVSMAPNLDPMLAAADAALIIGDAALKIDPARLSYPSLDLGEEWWKLTGLPMVFAIWAGRSQPLPLRGSYEYGRDHMDEYLAAEAARRGIDPGFARDYLTHVIRYDIGPEERRGLDQYLTLAATMEKITV